MKRPVTAIILALVSLILSPILVFAEFTALFAAAMITYEPANPGWIKALSLAFVIVIAILALALPVIAITVGSKARAASRVTATDGSGLATAAVVIGVIVTAGVVAAQVYFALMVAGSCSLERC